ncbi:MAG: hypothetical protein A2Y97_12610 [Nitrospirae bacterium RBG_13_39_12]|nr:MAG: hypothetical protein A2Y97_12610 [Nitrospirae bacterium RBG_13_39_12]
MNKTMKTELFEILVCPVCKGPLSYEQVASAEALRCFICNMIYPVVDGIPDMFPMDSNSERLTKDEGWDAWHTKLSNFVQWRRRTWDGSARAEKLQTNISDMNERFSDFTGLKDSSKKIIDIGCGGGGIRTLLGECRYYGIDPLLLEEHHYDFSMVKGIGEHLPFREGFFDEAILSQVLDHCKSIDRLVEETVRVISASGTVNIMQYIYEPGTLLDRLYKRLLRVYYSIKGVKNLDTKTMSFDRQELVSFFQERFEKVTFFEYSSSQVFIKATGWKKNRK